MLVLVSCRGQGFFSLSLLISSVVRLLLGDDRVNCTAGGRYLLSCCGITDGAFSVCYG
jgi:hypothetical protein